MLTENPVRQDIYQLDLWAGKQLLWNSSFKPSEHGEWGGAGRGAEGRGGAGRGGAAGIPAVCWAGFIPGKGPSKQPPSFSQTRRGSCPFLGLSLPIFEMELGSRGHQAPLSSDISTFRI